MHTAQHYALLQKLLRAFNNSMSLCSQLLSAFGLRACPNAAAACAHGMDLWHGCLNCHNLGMPPSPVQLFACCVVAC